MGNQKKKEYDDKVIEHRDKPKEKTEKEFKKVMENGEEKRFLYPDEDDTDFSEDFDVDMDIDKELDELENELGDLLASIGKYN